MHQLKDKQKMDSSETPQIKVCEIGVLKSRKRKAKSFESTRTGGKSSGPVTRALHKETLREQSVSKRLNLRDHSLQNSAARIFNLDVSTFMGGSCKTITVSAETLNRRPPPTIIEIESSVENSGILSTCNSPSNGINGIIDQDIVKDEIPDRSPKQVTHSHENYQQMDPLSKEGQSESIASQHENECLNQEQGTGSHERNHGLGNLDNNGSNFGAQSMDPQLQDGERQCIGSPHKNRLKGSSTTGTTRDHILQAIINKHGDITKSCAFESELFKSLCLEGICKVVQKLYNTRFADLISSDMEEFYFIVKDAERSKLDVGWLRQHLEEIEKEMATSNRLKKCEEEHRLSEQKKQELVKAVETKTIELANLEHEIKNLEYEIKNLEEQQAIRAKEINSLINEVKSKCRSFDCLTDGLL